LRKIDYGSRHIDLAAEYGVTASAISMIKANRHAIMAKSAEGGVALSAHDGNGTYVHKYIHIYVHTCMCVRA
jgi:hypothetical protein